MALQGASLFYLLRYVVGDALRELDNAGVGSGELKGVVPRPFPQTLFGARKDLIGDLQGRWIGGLEISEGILENVWEPPGNGDRSAQREKNWRPGRLQNNPLADERRGIRHRFTN
jgi:hypothetical protein